MWDSVREFTDQAARTQSVGELNYAFGSMVSEWGFDNFVAIQVSSRQAELRAPLARSFGKPPISWLNRYREAGHIHRDAGIVRIMTSLEPYWWSEVQSGSLTQEQLLVFNEAKEFDISHGLVVPIRHPNGSVWSCALAATRVDETEELKFAAVVAANYFVGRGVLLQLQEKRRVDLAFKLTKRQREVVSWLARGLTIDEIGDVLGTSGRTVSHQLDDAKRRLNARTLASLVAEAVLSGEVNLVTEQ